LGSSNTIQGISGDIQGTIFSHLRASRELILSLSSQGFTDVGRYGINHEVFGLCMELYTYLVYCNTFAPHGLCSDRTLPLDAFITSNEAFQAFPTFGVVFAGSHKLYQLIPAVSLLASQRLSDEEIGISEPSIELLTIHDDIHHQLTTWKMSPASRGHETTNNADLLNHIASALRHALHIYLLTAISGSLVLSPDTRASISWHINQLFLSTSTLVEARRYIATIIWPVMIAGSCLTNPVGRQSLLTSLEDGFYQMKQLEVCGKVLRLLWEDEDPRMFGPYGLGLVMAKYGLNMANV
jgi:hypothetical protein